MDLQTSGLFFVILSSLSCTFGIHLDGHGYTNVLIAINPAVPEDPALLLKIEDMLKDASSYLFNAVGNRFYFKNVTVLVPANWPGTYSKAKLERYDKAHVIIDDPNSAYGDEPYTLQYGQCGDEGQYIHLTPHFMLDDKHIKTYGERGRVFVHEWAHLRWGLYDEYNEEEPFYLSGDLKVEATRCSLNITGLLCPDRDCSKRCNVTNGLPTSDCMFVVNQSSTAKESIMANQGLDVVSEFCSAETHNAEAPNRQNQMCGNRAALDVILNSSVDAGVPEPSVPPRPQLNLMVVQRKIRTVCLTLDVSWSMGNYGRITRLQQAATLFLRDIIEETAYVGIVQFSGDASIRKVLTEITGSQSREDLVSAIPTATGGSTHICKGIREALKALGGKVDMDTWGDEIVILTDGEASDVIKHCENDVIQNGVIVHTIALGPDSDKTLNDMSNITGGIFFYAGDRVDSNELVDAFASLTTSDGNLTHQTVQLESTGIATSDWFNGSFSVDWTVGNGTVITIVYEVSLPIISIRSPIGDIFDRSNFTHDSPTKTSSLKIPGTAEVGEWHYSLLNVGSRAQAMAITVTSRASRVDVPPITVKAHMNQKASDGSKAMVVYASVTQKGLPVIMADVTATLVSDTGHTETSLQLWDNGAGADAIRHDGIYSAYFIKLNSGRYSLKVRVQNKDKARISAHRHSGAMYNPGYVVNGQVVMNPPKPPVNHEPVEVGSFSRTATGESFVVELGSSGPPSFPPCKITDLKAKLEGDNVTLTWTAPGASYDQGTASLYHIHWSGDLGLLRGDFDKSEVVNTSALSPQEAGSIEEYTFSSYNFNITNGTIVFFAIAAENADTLQSEMSNTARVVKFEPPVPQQHKSIDMIAIAVSGTVAVIVVMIAGIVIVYM